jgi:cytochrome c oxidase subunit 4
MNESLVSTSLYFRIAAALMLLLALTIGMAFINLGELNLVVAVTIAVVKAVLVVLYFMHVRYSSRVTWVVASAAVFWLAILFALTMSDFLSRP